MADPTEKPDGEPADLSAEELDGVAGGAFHTQPESGLPIEVARGGNTGTGTVTYTQPTFTHANLTQ